MKKMKSVVCLCAALSSAMTVGAAAMPVLAAEDKKMDLSDEMSVQLSENDKVNAKSSDFNVKSDEIADKLIEEAKKLPASIDLRNYNGKNYVTPVKYQAPYTSCWAFSIAGASEISYLFENNLGVPAGEANKNADFSEKYINWNIYNNIASEDADGINVEADQVGEGYDTSEARKKDVNAVFGYGGNMGYASNLLASGMGPVSETYEVNGETPFIYAGKNKWRLNDKEESAQEAQARRDYYYKYYGDHAYALVVDGVIDYKYKFHDWFNETWGKLDNKYYTDTFKNGYYAPFDDWSIPSGKEYHFPSVMALFKGSYVLPPPVEITKDFKTVLHPEGVAAIKLEISKGRGVGIGFVADESTPDSKAGDDGYMNRKNWAQYYGGEKPQSNHGVTIVGYDDNYPKENFTRTLGGKVVENSTPPGNGAFIVKNSWGALTEEDKKNVKYDEEGNPIYDNPNARAWGINDSGYFYLSYYDHSIVSAESYEFYSDDELPYKNVDYAQHDLFQGLGYEERTYKEKVSMANVFDVKRDGYLSQISFMTVSPGTKVHYEIYKDIEEDNPTSGTLLESGDLEYDIGGCRRIVLGDNYFLKKGEKYSVVVTQTHKENDGKEVYAEVCGYMENPYSTKGAGVKTIINKGESYLFKDGKWIDQTEVAKEYIKGKYEEESKEYGGDEMQETYLNGIDDFGMDNYAIKAFIVPAEDMPVDPTDATDVTDSSPKATDGTSDDAKDNDKTGAKTAATNTGDRTSFIPVIIIIAAATAVIITVMITVNRRKSNGKG